VAGAGRRTLGRAAISALMILYCIAIWSVIDFAWSSLSSGSAGSPRIAHPGFHHTLAENFDGFSIYAEHLHRLYTNSLGFKDATVRRVPLRPSTRRVVLIGDSFTEGVGLPSRTPSPACSSPPARDARPRSNSSMPASPPIHPQSFTGR